MTDEDPLRAIDLFCGAGGFSLGLQEAGILSEWAVDHWQPAVDCFNANILHALAERADIAADFDSLVEQVRGWGEFDVICGGPPCQDFSLNRAHEAVHGERAELTPIFARFVAAVKPKWVVMENVTVSWRAPAYARALRILQAAGYHIHAEKVDCSRFGVPQARERLITIGRIDWLPWSILGGLGADDHQLTMRAYFESIGEPLDCDWYISHHQFVKMRRCVYSVDRPSVCMTTGYHQYSDYEHPLNPVPQAQAMKLTRRQRAAIQTFPSWYKWPDAHTPAQRLIGNAVPPALAKRIGARIVEAEHEISNEKC